MSALGCDATLEIGTAGHYSLAGADIDYLVRVPNEEAAEAKKILTAYAG